MLEGRNILGWLGVETEHSIILDSVKHVDETCRTVSHMSDAVKAFIGGDLSAKTVAIENVKQSERSADRLRAAIISQLSEGVLLPPHRDDLMRFVKALDKIADCTNSAARLLGLVEKRPPDNILKNISISTELIVAGVARLRDAVRALGEKEMKRAIECCGEVERLEHEADDQKRVLLDAVLHAGLDPVSLLLCYNLAESLENITDKIDTASDMVKLMVVKYK